MTIIRIIAVSLDVTIVNVFVQSFLYPYFNTHAFKHCVIFFRPSQGVPTPMAVITEAP